MLFGLLRRMGLNYKDFEQLYRRMVFNVIARNHDDHTKNFSFLWIKRVIGRLLLFMTSATRIILPDDGQAVTNFHSTVKLMTLLGRTCWLWHRTSTYAMPIIS